MASKRYVEVECHLRLIYLAIYSFCLILRSVCVLGMRNAPEARSVCLNYEPSRVSKGNRKEIPQVTGNISGVWERALSQDHPLCQVPHNHSTGASAHVLRGKGDVCLRETRGPPAGRKKPPRTWGISLWSTVKMSQPVCDKGGNQDKGRVGIKYHHWMWWEVWWWFRKKAKVGAFPLLLRRVIFPKETHFRKDTKFTIFPCWTRRRGTFAVPVKASQYLSPIWTETNDVHYETDAAGNPQFIVRLGAPCVTDFYI